MNFAYYNSNYLSKRWFCARYYCNAWISEGGKEGKKRENGNSGAKAYRGKIEVKAGILL